MCISCSFFGIAAMNISTRVLLVATYLRFNIRVLTNRLLSHDQNYIFQLVGDLYLGINRVLFNMASNKLIIQTI